MKDNKIKVSIIVPVYNIEKYLIECFESLVNQTLKDIEIVVVNDESTDGSQKIIDKYVKKYKNIFKAFKQKNGGPGKARNYGIKKAKGEYLGFVDGDDYVDLDTFERLYDEAKKKNCDIVSFAVTYLKEFSIKKNFISHPEYFGTSVKKNPKILLESRCVVWDKLIRRSFWNKNNFKFPDIWFEDVSIMFNVLLVANKVECVNLPMYYYRETRAGSITNVLDIKNLDMLKACNIALDFYKKDKDYVLVEKQLENILLRYLISRLKFIKKCKYTDITKKVIEEYSKYLNDTFPNWKSSELLIYKNGNFKRNINNFLYKNPTLLKLYCKTPKNIKKATKNSVKKAKSIIKKIKTSSYDKNKKEQSEKENKRKYLQKNGYEVLAEIRKLFSEMNIIVFADFGTLLGLIRERQLLSHDLDIDMGILIDNKNKINYIRMFLEREGFRIWREFYYDNNLIEISGYYKKIKIDFNFYEIKDDKIITYLFYKEKEKKYTGTYWDCVRMTYTNFEKTKDIVIKNQKINIPQNPERLLSEKYGDFRTPNKDWIYWKSPAATKTRAQGYYIQYFYLNDKYSK